MECLKAKAGLFVAHVKSAVGATRPRGRTRRAGVVEILEEMLRDYVTETLMWPYGSLPYLLLEPGLGDERVSCEDCVRAWVGFQPWQYGRVLSRWPVSEFPMGQCDRQCAGKTGSGELGSPAFRPAAIRPVGSSVERTLLARSIWGGETAPAPFFAPACTCPHADRLVHRGNPGLVLRSEAISQSSTAIPFRLCGMGAVP